MEGTVTGNSVHYILDCEGRVLDALPGLYGPQAFLGGLQTAEQLHAVLRAQPTDDLRLAPGDVSRIAIATDSRRSGGGTWLASAMPTTPDASQASATSNVFQKHVAQAAPRAVAANAIAAAEGGCRKSDAGRRAGRATAG